MTAEQLSDLLEQCRVDILGIDFETPHLASTKHANFLLLCQEMENLLNWYKHFGNIMNSAWV